MSSVDDRIVEMKFDNTQFERGVKQTTSSLDTLNKSLKLEGATKGLNDVQAAAKGFSLGNIGAGIDALLQKFNALSIVGITALTNIANKAVDAGLRMVKSLTIDPIKSGLDEYETNLNSIQTILANTGLEGQAGLNKVNKALGDLNTYSDQTIYNFSEMARNIGTFTAAGVKLEPATAAIKGISNLAALSGSNAQQASTAMYQLSQAMATGKVSLMDWNSVVNAGMGGKVFQKALMDTARVSGVAIDDIIKKNGSFRESLQEGWLTTDILSKTLKQFTGDMTDAQLKSMGYSSKQIKEIQKLAKVAKGAATEVKTFSALVGTLQESVGSGWSQTWQLIFGDFGEAKKLWTSVNNVIGGFIQTSSDARNKVLGDWKALGGRTAAIDAIKNAFQAVMAVIKPIKDAFREIFPPTTGKQLYEITVAIRDFMKGLILSKEASGNLKVLFKGLFSVLKIGVDVIKGAVKFLFGFVSLLGGGTDGVLGFAGGIGSMLLKLTEWINSGNRIQSFFDMLSNARNAVIQPLIAFVGNLVEAFGSLLRGNPAEFITKLKGSFSALEPIVGSFQKKFAEISRWISEASLATQKWLINTGNAAWRPVIDILGKVSDTFAGIKASIGNIDTSGVKGMLSTVKSTGQEASSIWTGISEAMQRVSDIIQPVVSSVGNVFKIIIDKITNYIKNLNMQDAVALLNTGFFIAMYSMLRKFLKNLDGIVGDFRDMIGSITKVFDTLTDALKTLQQNVKATIILKIAAAVALLAAAVWTLSKIDGDALKKALFSLATMFVLLTGTMFAFSKMSFDGQAGLVKASTSLVLMAIAVKILASAVQDLSGLDWGEMIKGLVAVGALLGALILFTKFAEANQGGIKAGAGLILLAIAIKLLASSVSEFGNMDTETMFKGLAALGMVIAMLAGMVQVMNNTKGIVAASVGLLILSASLAALAIVLKFYAMFDFATFAYGLGLMASTLTLVGLAMRTMPENLPALSVGLLVVSGALLVLAGVMKVFSTMDGGDIAASLGMLGGSLLIIAAAMYAMQTAIPGAVALQIVSKALIVLAAALYIMGSMPWQAVALALGTLAATFLILGVAGALMGPVIPVLAALAVVIKALAISMLIAGAGFLAFAVGFALMAAVGTAGVAVLIAAFTGILNLIPLFMQQIGLGLRAFAKVISDSGPVIVAALTTILLSLLKAIDNIAPKFFDTMARLIMGLVNTVTRLIPLIVSAGIRLIISLLNAIGDRVGEIVKSGVKLINNFMRAIADNVPKLVQQGFKAVIDLINGITKAIDDNSEDLGRAGGRMAVAIVRGMVNGIGAGISEVVGAAQRMAENALNAALDFLGIRSPSREFFKIGKYSAQGMAVGLDAYSGIVAKSAESVGAEAIDSMRKTITGLSDLIDMNIDSNPTITPVLDLSNLDKAASGIESKLPSPTISVGTAWADAKRVSAGYNNNRSTQEGNDAVAASSSSLTFIQNNNSPKALSEAEIYRQTKNQISVAKEALAANAK